MASLPPGACCVKTWDRDGETVGKLHSNLYGLPGYETGDKTSSKVLIVAADIYGFSYKNSLLIADRFGAAGYHVFVPDLLKGDFAKSGQTDPNYLPTWFKNHDLNEASGMFRNYVKTIQTELKPSYTAAIGYCFGAKFVIEQLSKDGLLDVGAAAHPSFVAAEDVEAITKPLIISAAEIDPIFTVDLRHQTEQILAKNKARYQIDLFGGVSHGFAVRGNLDDPVVFYAQAKAFNDQVAWFEEFAPKN